MKEINFDKAKYEGLKKAWQQAVTDEKESFMFEGDEFGTMPAKYMLELLKPIYERNINLS